MAKAGGGKKRIFVSDIHMGDERSIKPPNGLKPYSWLLPDRAKMFGDFLGIQLKDPDVKEVIILGDLFDDWVCPAQLDPMPAKPGVSKFHEIAQASQNVEAINNLKAIADSDQKDLIYVPGNHDMLITKEIITNIIPGIKYMGTGEGQGVYTADGISGEHGNMYTLFNAPDPYSNQGYILPLGYFITRVVTEREARTGEHLEYLEALKVAIGQILGKADFAKMVFATIVKGAGMSNSSEIIMGGINDYLDPLMPTCVEKIFGDLYDTWDKNMPNNVKASVAVADDTGHLFPAAFSQYLNKEGKSDIVIFGHTHIYELHGTLIDWNEEDGQNNQSDFSLSSKQIYANSGTWVNDKKRCTFVETQIDENAKKHFVRVNQYKEDGEIKTLKEKNKRL